MSLRLPLHIRSCVLPAALLLTVACSSSSSSPPKGAEVATASAPQAGVAPSRTPEVAVPVDSFYSTVHQAALSGAVVRLASENPSTLEQVLLEFDFEDGRMGNLSPFSLERKRNKALDEHMAVEKEAGIENRALRIEGGIDQALCVRSAPIPVREGGTYTLTYMVKAENLQGPTGARVRLGTVEPLFYAVPSFHHNPEGHLKDEGNRKRAQVVAPGNLRGPEKRGSSAWATHTVTFTVPATANQLVLSLDHSRTADDQAAGKGASGVVWFDNLSLRMKDQPLHRRYANPDDLNSSPHPLQLRVELPAPDRGADTRYALYAPTDSSYRFKRTIPPRASLSLAAGVLREGVVSGRGKVRFVVDAVLPNQSHKTLMDVTLDPATREIHRYWNEAVIPLDEFAGQTLEIELRTEAEQPEERERFPGAAAVWGDPVLFSREGRGRLIVMTVIDTVSVGHVSSYGYGRETTPQLTRIAQGGTLFQYARSAAPWTLPSFASLFTGVDAVRHGAGERAWGEVVWRRPLPERFVTLAEQLRAQGFQTAAFVNNPYLTSAFGLGQGFTTYRDYGVGTRSGAGEVGVNLAMKWLEQHRGYDRFLVMHLMDSHGPYHPPKEFASKFTDWFYKGRFEGTMNGQDYLDLAEGNKPAEDEATRQQVKNLYDGALLYADSQTGRLFDAMEKHGGTPDTTFIVTSDHGEELFEHNGYEHGHQAYEEMLRVPLVIHSPARANAGLRVDEPVRLTDVLPTLLDFIGVPPVSGGDGYSLKALLTGGAPSWALPRPIFAENELYGSAQNALIQGRFKYLYNMESTERPHRRPKSERRHELYDLGVDAGETRNLAAEQQKETARLHAAMDRHTRPMMAGRYVLALEGGGQSHTFAGTLSLPEGASWFSYYEDLIAPLAEGGEGTLRVGLRGKQVSFEVRTTRALLAFKPQSLPAEGGGITLALTVDGSPWTSGVLLGAGGQAGGGEALLKLADPQLVSAAEAIPDPVSGRVAVWVGKTTERNVAAIDQKALPPETAERLRALGYLQ